MGRPKGSKNKPKIECRPPEDREPLPSASTKKAEALDVRLIALIDPDSRYDGVYVVGKKKNGGNYVGKLGYIDYLPLTSELKKKLGIE